VELKNLIADPRFADSIRMPQDIGLHQIPGLRPGTKAIDFSLPGVDGKTHSLASFADKPILVVFFSCNHCPYVQAWESRFVEVQKDYASKGVQLVAINSNDEAEYPEDDFAHMKSRAKDKGYNFPYLRDESQAVAEAYGPVSTPDFFVLDRERIVRYRGRLDDNHKDPKAVRQRYLRDALDDVVAGRAVRTPLTPPYGCSLKWKPGHFT
jgi:peroxiredoxin